MGSIDSSGLGGVFTITSGEFFLRVETIRKIAEANSAKFFTKKVMERLSHDADDSRLPPVAASLIPLQIHEVSDLSLVSPPSVFGVLNDPLSEQLLRPHPSLLSVSVRVRRQPRW